MESKRNEYKININKHMFLDFWPNHGPGCIPLDSARGDVQFAGVFAPVASVAVSFVSEFIFWNLVKKQLKSRPEQDRGNKTSGGQMPIKQAGAPGPKNVPFLGPGPGPGAPACFIGICR